MILIVAIALHSLSPVLLTRISAIVFIYAGVLSFNALDIQSIGSGIGIYSGLFHVTTVSQLIDTFIFVIGALILVAWPSLSGSESSKGDIGSVSPQLENAAMPVGVNRVIQTKLNSAGEYSLIVLFSTLGASLLISSADLISMYLSIELQSFGVYILSTLYRNSESATSAGLKYFLLGSLSSCLILLGTGLIYSFTGLTNLESIYSLVSVSDTSALGNGLAMPASANIIQGLNLGLIIIVIGFLFKISAAPLHHWAPDVYDDSPTIVTIWLTIMPKISIVIFLLELQTQLGIIGNNISVTSIVELLDSVNTLNISPSIYSLPLVGGVINTMSTYGVLKNLLLISSLLSLIIGTIVGLAQSKIKRLLSYSTISHVGFILLALAINTEQSIDSLIFYIIQYSLTNLNTFLIIIAFGYIIHSPSFSLPIISLANPFKPANNSNVHGRNGNTSDEGVSGLASPFPLKGSKREVQGGYKGSELDIKFISELKDQFFSNPLLSISLTICLFSMAGIPPLLGFFSKQFVLYSAIQSGYYFMSIVAIIVSVISASYYLKIIKVLHSAPTVEPATDSSCEAEGGVNKGAAKSRADEGLGVISNFHSFIISTLTLSILFFVLKPSIILNSTQLLSLSLFYY